ncbi:molybdenum cofactor biosynthesis protein B [Microbacterium sp. P01]|uniref:MogA/MoaB family molybdenum cofactor biosynthesis protein n=1 Tax=unclassified Microbacterium TaxID=2609290 RepID=UPI0036731AE5
MSHHHHPSSDAVATSVTTTTGFPAVVITVSDRSSRGERSDASGPIAVDALTGAGFACEPATIVPDGADAVEAALRAALERGARLIVTTGGTGIAARDLTPEGTSPVLSRVLPGIAEELRRIGTAEKPGGMLSRGLAGVVDPSHDRPGALIVNLPGSTGAVASGMSVVVSVAAHVISQLGGGDHE